MTGFSFAPFAQDARPWDPKKHPRGKAGHWSAQVRPAEGAHFHESVWRPFRSGEPMTFDYHRMPSGVENFGAKFGQDVEPAGRYMRITGSPPAVGERGRHRFENPLVIEHGHGHREWKDRLSQAFGGKTGRTLSDAVVDEGHDGIVTVSGGLPNEVVDLKSKPHSTKEP